MNCVMTSQYFWSGNMHCILVKWKIKASDESVNLISIIFTEIMFTKILWLPPKPSEPNVSLALPLNAAH